ncbi:cytidylyltransferase protein [Rutstroemia sp. NJR-2017a BVV2]|nr:cytidylyltransferase protein [Rutstroemia sp. NJR-2017a BVV2]
MLQSLLLLPQHPAPITATALSAAFSPSISACLSILKGSASNTRLIIGIASADFHERLSGPRAQIYNEVEQLLGGLYSLISLICAQQGIEVVPGLPRAIDVRIVLLDYDSTRSLTTDQESENSHGILVPGPIVDLSVFASTQRQWDHVFSVEGESGQKLLRDYLELANRISPPLQAAFHIVGGGLSMIQKATQSIKSGSSVSHNVVAVGGDELLKNKKYAEYLQSWEKRQSDVVDFLVSILSFMRTNSEDTIQTIASQDSNGRAIYTKLKAHSITLECIEIQDAYGPTITDETVTALVVSGETRSGGQSVNEKRVEKGWKPLEIYEVDVLDAEDKLDSATKTENFASKISSTALRKHKADRAQTSSL